MNHRAFRPRQPGFSAAWREERLCSLSSPESTTFFRSGEKLSPRFQAVFSRREERLCSPSLSKSTTFFVSQNFSFCRPKSFSSIAGSGYAPPCSQGQQLFSLSQNFPFRPNQVVFLNREEWLCSPPLHLSTAFCILRKIRWRNVSIPCREECNIRRQHLSVNEKPIFLSFSRQKPRLASFCTHFPIASNTPRGTLFFPCHSSPIKGCWQSAPKPKEATPGTATDRARPFSSHILLI